MAEKFPSKKNLTSREASLIDAPLFFLQDILPTGGTMTRY